MAKTRSRWKRAGGIAILTRVAPGLLLNPLHLLSLGFGSGLAPKAPGTAGTALALLPYWFIAQLPLGWYLAVVAGAFALGIYLCHYTGKALGVADHPGIVWDEFVGLWVTMIAAPPSWQWIVTGFVLFRLFDIWKPWPIKTVDKSVKGGFGVMLDDLLAGIYGLACLQLIIFLLDR